MADTQTMQAYAQNIDAYKALVEDMPENPHLDRFLALLADGADILDLGCGVGHASAVMRDRGFVITCMDASPDMIDAAQHLHGLAVLQRNFTDLDARDAFDGIWASYSLPHAPKAEMPGNLQRIYAALRIGGTCYIGLKLGDSEERDAVVGRVHAVGRAVGGEARVEVHGGAVRDVERGVVAALLAWFGPSEKEE